MPFNKISWSKKVLLLFHLDFDDHRLPVLLQCLYYGGQDDLCLGKDALEGRLEGDRKRGMQLVANSHTSGNKVFHFTMTL